MSPDQTIKFITPGMQLNKPVTVRQLQDGGSCFGKCFSKSAVECKQCTAPVLLNNRIVLFKELCEATCKATEVAGLRKLSALDISNMLAAGKTVREIWLEILNGGDVKVYGTQARTLLAQRFRYLEQMH